MPIINFAIPTVLEKKITQTIEQKGFSSKAEFFRFAAISFLDQQSNEWNSDPELSYLIQSIKKQTKIKFNKRKIPSVREQLKDL
ncbi:MAG: Uncharacterized protein G01um101418_895 [Parcubacteria group bacterium Gr01-1014_18]|nr:MAG: Uncharacterized protein Greene041636_934 [Parcubacteria group bacterium Greene0416_36]TSC79791.1 MAG: Uncharacterized protein G01um101418_895 [Parcubacteria group bacterium Gr01-1014_18]TSC98075.1 MAG: Uncharacterized protein Greene101420_904 [Parcubacteria group bacterium Greene1014_20]TSD06510.1 MAG: Uncharacterized protein Greene07142_853 [Parcubacteria group bacterium Greene0714_2]